MVRLTINLLLIAAALLAGCYYDNAEELYPNDCKTSGISYQSDIVPVLQQRCYQCHSISENQGNVTLEGYSNISGYVSNGKLMGAIRHDNGFSPMPQDGGQLNSCQLGLFETWISEGAQNN